MDKLSVRIAIAVVFAAVVTTAAFCFASTAIFVKLYAGHVGFFDLNPIRTFQYKHYYWDTPGVKWKLILSWVIATAIAVVPLAAAMFAIIHNLIRGKSLYGDARWATPYEIKGSGLLGEKGIIVGKIGGRFLLFDSQQFVLLYAPTRSGKGVGVVVPNLLNYGESVVVLDVKPELWRLTSGFRRKHGQACFMFAPLQPNTHRWNPLSYISEDQDRRITDIQTIANMLVPDKPGVEIIWTANPRKLFLGVVLYLLETPGVPVTLGEVLRQLSTFEDTATYFKRIIKERDESDNPLSFSCTQALLSFIGVESEKTRSGIKESLTSALELFGNPAIDAATSANDFDLRDVRKKLMSIYVCMSPDLLKVLAPIVNLFFQQLVSVNTREMPENNPELKYQCLLVMDEFPAIGKLNVLADAIAFIAGFNLRLLTICQSPSQIRALYTPDVADNYFDNHALEIIFATKNNKIRREISEKLGDTTSEGRSISRARWDTGKGPNTESISTQKRALLLPQEITDLGFKKEIVILEGMKPIRAKKVIYWKDKAFRDRVIPPAPVPVLDLSYVQARQAQLQAERKAVVHVDGDEVEPPEFQSVTVENIESIENRAPQMNLADLDLPDELLDQVPETVTTEDEVDALVKLFLQTAEA